jgi:hypothetical protein
VIYNRPQQKRAWLRREADEFARLAAEDAPCVAELDFEQQEIEDFDHYPDPDWYMQTKEGQIEECWSVYNEFYSPTAPRWIDDEPFFDDDYFHPDWEPVAVAKNLPSPRRLN